MDRHRYDRVINDVAADTLESLALMFLLPEDDAPQPPPPCTCRAAVAFTGPFGGTLVLGASAELLPELAANMLGAADGQATTPDQQVDALKELTNVVCGNLLPAIVGDKPVFHIRAPQLVPADVSTPADPEELPAGAARLHADAGMIEVALFMDARVPAATG